MKNRTLPLLLALTLCLSLAAPAAAAADLSPAPGTMTYTQVISPQYEDAGLFGDGLAPVKQNGKGGYINAENEVVVPFQYDLAGFVQGRFGCIDLGQDVFTWDVFFHHTVDCLHLSNDFL